MTPALAALLIAACISSANSALVRNTRSQRSTDNNADSKCEHVALSSNAPQSLYSTETPHVLGLERRTVHKGGRSTKECIDSSDRDEEKTFDDIVEDKESEPQTRVFTFDEYTSNGLVRRTVNIPILEKLPTVQNTNRARRRNSTQQMDERHDDKTLGVGGNSHSSGHARHKMGRHRTLKTCKDECDFQSVANVDPFEHGPDNVEHSEMALIKLAASKAAIEYNAIQQRYLQSIAQRLSGEDGRTEMENSIKTRRFDRDEETHSDDESQSMQVFHVRSDGSVGSRVRGQGGMWCDMDSTDRNDVKLSEMDDMDHSVKQIRHTDLQSVGERKEDSHTVSDRGVVHTPRYRNLATNYAQLSEDYEGMGLVFNDHGLLVDGFGKTRRQMLGSGMSGQTFESRSICILDENSMLSNAPLHTKHGLKGPTRLDRHTDEDWSPAALEFERTGSLLHDGMYDIRLYDLGDVYGDYTYSATGTSRHDTRTSFKKVSPRDVPSSRRGSIYRKRSIRSRMFSDCFESALDGARHLAKCISSIRLCSLHSESSIAPRSNSMNSTSDEDK